MSVKLPSTVIDTEFLWMPSERKVVDDDEEWEKCGNWILCIPNNDLSWADKVWTDLQALLNNGCLLLLKASTAAFKESRVILCYTRPGQEEARKAAEAIREVVHYEYPIVHKSNKATNDALRYEDTLSKYMHTFLGHFYVRDAIRRWKFVDTRNESSIIGKNHEEPETANIPLGLQQHLPSSGKFMCLNRFTSGLALTLLTAARGTYPGFFTLCCSSQKREDGLIEADCVWSAVKSLFDDDDFYRIRSFPHRDTKSDIYCDVTDYSDLQMLVNIAKRIFEKSRYSSIIHFVRKTNDKKSDVHYMFTHGEVYKEVENNFHKFILSFEI